MTEYTDDHQPMDNRISLVQWLKTVWKAAGNQLTQSMYPKLTNSQLSLLVTTLSKSFLLVHFWSLFIVLSHTKCIVILDMTIPSANDLMPSEIAIKLNSNWINQSGSLIILFQLELCSLFIECEERGRWWERNWERFHWEWCMLKLAAHIALSTRHFFPSCVLVLYRSFIYSIACQSWAEYIHECASVNWKINWISTQLHDCVRFCHCCCCCCFCECVLYLPFLKNFSRFFSSLSFISEMNAHSTNIPESHRITWHSMAWPISYENQHVFKLLQLTR